MPKFTVKSHEREREESEGGAALQSGPSAQKIAQHTAEEHRLERDSSRKSEKPTPLLPLSDD